MIDGTYIDEIRQLPENNVYRFFFDSIEREREENTISADAALEACSKLIEDYKKYKIAEDLNKKQKIVVIDAIMGAGKSTYVINEIINKNPQYHYICVLPTLKECERYKTNIHEDTFRPRIFKADDGKHFKTKSDNLKKLISMGVNIITTHALIQLIDSETIELLQQSNYVLILDECLQVVQQYDKNFKKSDLKSILDDKYVTLTENGYLIWNNEKDKEKEYNGRWNDIKRLCNLHSLMLLKKQNGEYSDSIVMWNFPAKFFSLFEKCYICTYLWNGSIQKAYFDMHKIKYSHMTLFHNQLDTYDPSKESEARKQYFDLINLYSGNLNTIGIPDKKTKSNKNPLTSTWYDSKLKNIRRNKIDYSMNMIKCNTRNFFKNYAKTLSDENMYTVFEKCQIHIQDDGFKKGYVACNAKATNEYKHKVSLAYLINYYPPTNIIHFFKSNCIEVNQDLYALAEMLQWIWRSRIREGKPINLYMPSQRMRELLGQWALGNI